MDFLSYVWLVAAESVNAREHERERAKCKMAEMEDGQRQTPVYFWASVVIALIYTNLHSLLVDIYT